MLASPTSLFSLLATIAILANEAQALPTRRSTSQLSRRAQRPKGLRRSPDGLSFSGRAKRTTTGDHSIIVDASASTSADPSSSAGGIKNSTINLTVISKREEPSSIFARVVRSLFGGSSEPLTAAPIVEKRQPSPVAIHQGTRHQGTRRHVKAGKALREKRSKPAARKVERALEERAGLYQTDLSEQQSIYRAAVAALNEPTATSSSTEAFSTKAAPVVNAVVSGSVSSSVVVEPTSTSSPIVNPKSTLLAASSPSALASAASPAATDVSLEPITLTMTLIPAGPGGAYIDQAAIPSSSISAEPILSASSPLPRSASSSAEFASTTAGSAPSSFRKARRGTNKVAARAVHAHAEKREWVKVAHF